MITLTCVVALILGFLYVLYSSRRQGRDLPPGPPTLPLIGNLHQIPKTKTYLKFTEWAQQYGGIFSLKIGPVAIIVISSPCIVRELIDKRSASYGDRPPSHVADLITHGDHPTFLSNGPPWRLWRRLLHQYFNEKKCEREHLAVQNAEAVQMLRDFCQDPDKLMLHPRRFSNSIVMSLVKFARIADRFSELIEVGATPPVDIFPMLKWVPERLFGNWMTRCQNLREVMKEFYGGLVSHVIQRRLNSDAGMTSFLDGILNQQEKLNFTYDQLSFTCGNLLEAGTDTTSNMVLGFIQAMIKFPHIQRKAHEAIDSVLGDDRSPLWSDYDNLPYIAMTVKETMRWRPVTPLALPRFINKGDTFNNLCIPPHSTVILNVWALHHDPARFPSPEIFDPERFRTHTLPAYHYTRTSNRDHFGYSSGRRLCPGIHLAERNLFLAAAKLLWAFEFSEKRDEEGKLWEVDVDPKSGYKEGIVLSPLAFQAEVRVRGEGRRATIMKEMESAEKDIFAKYDLAELG